MKKYAVAIAGLCAGAVNGLFGAGGGMVLVPLLTKLTELEEEKVFPVSVSIILPICFVSLSMSLDPQTFNWTKSLPYFLGSGIGGLLAGVFGKKIPTLWLHRMLGILILWGGVRYLC